MSAISQLLKDCESENDWNCVYSNDREVFFVDIEKWLQSLKQRANWKPTEEQIQALNEAVGIVGLFTPIGSYLKSLSEQLKRL